MSQVVDDFDARLGAHLRALRKVRGWSLSELAEQSGLPRPNLDRIERGLLSPTAAQLNRLSATLGLPLSRLVADAQEERALVSHADAREPWTDPASGFMHRTLSAMGSGSRLELSEAVLPPGAALPYPASAYVFAEQQILILNGTLTLVEGEFRHYLRAGDCLTFGPPSDCEFRNEDLVDCQYLIAVVRPG